MSDEPGWRPMAKPRKGAEAFVVSPFTRLARAHVVGAAGDALVTIALANSLFFDLDPNDARWKVFLYLALTMAPLALVSPFIGPVLDQSTGGRRWMIVAVDAGRAVICILMINDLDSLLLFPEAFAVLALGKAYGVSRAAVVPTVVSTDEELVEANSKLQLLSGLAAIAAGPFAGIGFALGHSSGVIVMAVLFYGVATVLATQIPPTQIADAPATPAETAELRGIGILLAASAMGLVRGIVGFLTFLVLFDLRNQVTWHMGLVLAFTGAGALLGSVLAPVLRRSLTEERMIESVLGLGVVAGVLAGWAGGLAAAGFMAAAVAVVSTSGRLAFDSLVQRDAPDANRGRSFARFELRFQIVWVIGAVIPVLIPIPLQVGFILIAATAGFALFSYIGGRRAARRSHADRVPAGPGIPPDTDEPANAATREIGLPPMVDPTVRWADDTTVDPTWTDAGEDD